MLSVVGMALVKICGVTDADALDLAVRAGARWLGFVFHPKSPRRLSPEAAAALAKRAHGRAETVAVTVDAEDSLLDAIAATLKPDYIQAHGSESPARLAALRRFARRGVIKAVPVARMEDFAGLDAFAPVADFFLFDAKAPAEAAIPGGNGAAFDWPLLRVARPARPWFLAGGLTPENVQSAIAASGAERVDVSSGVERAPGLKDPARIAAFLAAAEGAIIA
jgi:phosphoribosylanthranilate isomerase